MSDFLKFRALFRINPYEHSELRLILTFGVNRISTRRAAVFAYINSLLLRTLPAIDYDRLNNIKDPSKQRPNQNPAATPSDSSLDALLGDIDPAKKPS